MIAGFNGDDKIHIKFTSLMYAINGKKKISSINQVLSSLPLNFFQLHMDLGLNEVTI